MHSSAPTTAQALATEKEMRFKLDGVYMHVGEAAELAGCATKDEIDRTKAINWSALATRTPTTPRSVPRPRTVRTASSASVEGMGSAMALMIRTQKPGNAPECAARPRATTTESPGAFKSEHNEVMSNFEMGTSYQYVTANQLEDGAPKEGDSAV